MLDTLTIFQSLRTILRISKFDISFFTKLLCIFAIFTIIILNFGKKTFFLTSVENVSILKQNLKILLPKPTMVCLLLFY